ADEALVDRGEYLIDLGISLRQRGLLVLDCPVNESRFRPGTRIDLSCDATRLSGMITDITERGLRLHVRVERRVDSLPRGPWTARESDIDLSFLVSQCLTRLQPGAPGWSFLSTLAGGEPLNRPAAAPPTSATAAIIDRVIADVGRSIDSCQRIVLDRCASLPSVYGIQGPPGTGKTMVLALTAETLARMGRRVMVVAPTHQAVNNALSAIHSFFPVRPLVKVGDELRRESLDEAIPCRPVREATQGLPPRRHQDLIVGMTFVSGLHNQALRSSGLVPNALLIDEAGQIPLVQGACAGLFGASATLLFGDDAQLPPVFAADVAEDPLAVSLFQRLRQAHPSLITRLNTTYRMNAELCGIVAAEFYAGSGEPLMPSPAVAGNRFQLPGAAIPEGLPAAVISPEPSLVWVLTPDTHSRQANEWEADAIARLVATCLRHGKSVRDVAVVTPFRKQAALIRRRMQALLPADAVLPIVDTVERVQGLTVDLVAISLAASDPDFVSEVAGFLFSPNRLNVAISRARTKVVVACSPTLLEAMPADYAAFLGRETLSRVLAGRAGGRRRA
ncbi:MAG: ATP-dependent RecD-like helicase, partial [Planctomycetota bacterium]